MVANLHINHWTMNCFKQVVGVKEYQAILDKQGILDD